MSQTEMNEYYKHKDTATKDDECGNAWVKGNDSYNRRWLIKYFWYGTSAKAVPSESQVLSNCHMRKPQLSTEGARQGATLLLLMKNHVALKRHQPFPQTPSRVHDHSTTRLRALPAAARWWILHCMDVSSVKLRMNMADSRLASGWPKCQGPKDPFSMKFKYVSLPINSGSGLIIIGGH